MECANDGMSPKRYLAGRREDLNLPRLTGLRIVQKHGLGVVELSCNQLLLLWGERIGSDRYYR